tara:strand:- start:159 stop:329 length:171 start_codon:yes stop_codon:yes gene_type:complete
MNIGSHIPSSGGGVVNANDLPIKTMSNKNVICSDFILLILSIKDANKSRKSMAEFQ